MITLPIVQPDRSDPGSHESPGSKLTVRIAARAAALGFDLFGVCAAGPVSGYDQFQRWASHGYAGEMQWLTKEPHRRSDPRVVMPSCRSVICAGMIYRTAAASGPPTDIPLGQIARYARGEDYHEILRERLHCLLAAVGEEAGGAVQGKVYVDTGPLLERDLAYAAGLGWRAKNTHLIHPRAGSYFFLGEVLLDLELEPAEPAPDRCGSCSRCLDACPTQAFIGAGILDARRCISYLTIELRGPIPRELRPLMGNMIFGCDICQEVCPWNRHAPLSADPLYRARTGYEFVDLIALMGFTQEQFSTHFRGSSIKRTKRRGLLRNVAVALGNSHQPAAVPALSGALSDVEPLIRGHAAWALGTIGGEAARTALTLRHGIEEDAWVNEEITLALHEWTA